jgi:CheY-like chemotaxis protein
MTPPARILVVDDEPALGVLLLRLLREEGYTAVATEDGPSEWAAARAAGQPFDLVVTNWSRHGLVGSQVLALLEQEYPGAPILHLDALNTPRVDLWPDRAVYAPFSTHRFLTEVQRLLAVPSTQRSAPADVLNITENFKVANILDAVDRTG